MVQTLTERKLSAQESEIVGRLLVEILNGEINQETRDALYNLKDIPEPYGHLIRYAQGYALDKASLAKALQDELRIICIELEEPRWKQPVATGIDWIAMYGILEAILTGSDRDLRGEAAINAEVGLEVPSLDRSPAWARPLIQHIKNSTTQGDELTLELLNVLEAQIQKRKAELAK